jgi:hypothetical protein
MERFNFEFLDKDSYFQQVIANAEDHSEERKQSTKVTPKKVRKGYSGRWFEKSLNFVKKIFSRGDGGHDIFAVMGTLALNSWRGVQI